MGRWIRRLPVVALAVCAGLTMSGAGGVGDAHPSRGPVVVTSVRQVALMLRYPSGRAHPEGPDEEPTRARPSYSQAATRLWTGGGRHPVWRGCRHVYDPKLGRFIFASAP